MPQIVPLPYGSLPDEVQRRLGERASDAVHAAGMRIISRREDLALALLDFRAAVAGAATLPPRLHELVRLRIAFHNDCLTCKQARSIGQGDLDESLACRIADGIDDETLSDAERAALQYADHLSWPQHHDADEAVSALKANFTDAEIVEIAVAAGINLGIGRAVASWRVPDHW